MTLCPNAAVQCPQCKYTHFEGREITNATLDMHLKEECLGMSLCQKCRMPYKLSRNINGKAFDHDCTDSLFRLIETIVGSSSYSKSITHISEHLDLIHQRTEPSNSKKTPGEGQLETQLMDSMKSQDKTVRSIIANNDDD
jgi:hypothetical protein